MDLYGNWTTSNPSPSATLPRLQTLSLKGGPSLEYNLNLAATLAPAVEKVSIINSWWSSSTAPPSSFDLAPSSFPQVRLLAVDSVSTFPIGLLSLPLRKLESLRVKLVKGDTDTMSVPSPLPTRFPIAMRELVVEWPGGATVTGLDALEAACIQHGVAFVARRYVGPVPRPPWAPPGAPVVVAPPVPGQATHMQDTLGWASERIRWLEELDDGPGLQEMAEATELLRERRAIERS
ncbi:hypothetical protein JCM8208_007738 [Rhodotorula glutinis]